MDFFFKMRFFHSGGGTYQYSYAFLLIGWQHEKKDSSQGPKFFKEICFLHFLSIASHPIQFLSFDQETNEFLSYLDRQTARPFKRTWLKGRAFFHNFCFSDFCLFLLPYDYPLLTVKFSYFSDQDWDSRYCRDVPYQAQAQLTIYPLLKSLAENKIKGNYGFCILV